MSTRVIPHGDNVLVRQRKPRERTASGLVLPDSNTTVLVEGEVLAVGPGAWSAMGALRPVSLAVGQVVLYNRHAGTEVVSESVAGEKLYLVSEQVVQAVVAPGQE